MILKKAVRDILDHHPIVVDAQRVWSAPASYPNNRDRATAMLSAWTQNLEHQLKFLTSKFVPGPSLVVDGGKPVSFYPVPGTFHLFAPTNTVPLSRRIKYGLQKADWVPTPQAPASFAPKPGLPPSVPSAGSNNVAFANAVNEEQSEAVKVTGKQVKVTGEQFIPTLASDGSLIPVYDWDGICAAGIDLLSLTEKPLVSYSNSSNELTFSSPTSMFRSGALPSASTSSTRRRRRRHLTLSRLPASARSVASIHSSSSRPTSPKSSTACRAQGTAGSPTALR